MGPDTQITEIKFEALREFIEINFRHIRERLERLQGGLDQLAATAITKEAYQYQSRSIQRAHTRLNAHQEEIRKHRFAYRLLEILGMLVGTITLAVLVALATGKATITWQ